ncbi:MFS transporter [Corynebacterium lizhenjunii]|uniref:MFS transporter n=1 Tax=Corynebacterium lizhenjunii TaxID=2709394 RepID=A0A7T0PD38_9CORY|nr:MFS transporter [Corynebacterium lizhenjunii]
MVAMTAAFGAWSLLLPLLPLAVLDHGGSAGLAGATTGIFMAATVVTQILTPWLLRRWGYRPVMAVSAAMLGVPALGHLLGMEPGLVLLFCALRGVGFGALTVAQSAMIAELVPLRYLGKATGTMGVFVGLSQMLFLPAGLWIQGQWSYDAAYITAACMGALGMVMCVRLPSIKPAPAQGRSKTAAVEDRATPAEDPAPPRRAATWKLVLVPALSVTTLSMSYGLIASFLPASVREIDPVTGAVLGGIMLSVVGGAAMVFRYFAGMVADRTGKPGLLSIPSQLVAFSGLALMAGTMAYHWHVGWLVVAAVLFGGAFGIIQNEALLSMFSRLPRENVSEASAVWNIFYDAGTGLGSVLLAGLVTAAGYATAYGAGALIILAGVVMTGLDFYLGAHRIAEHDNIKTRLQRMRKV